MPLAYTPETVNRAEVDQLPGLTLLQFGTNWCGHCERAEPLIDAALAQSPVAPRRIQVEDGSGRPLGRSYAVRLWPTLLFLRDGQEVARLVRPTDTQAIAQALDTLAATQG